MSTESVQPRTPCVRASDRASFMASFRGALYGHGLIESGDSSACLRVDAVLDIAGATIVTFAYCVPLRTTVMVIPHLLFARAFSPQFVYNLPFQFQLRDVRVSETYHGEKMSAPWVLFSYSIFPIVRDSDIRPSAASMSERCSNYALSQAKASRSFRDTVYITATVESIGQNTRAREAPRPRRRTSIVASSPGAPKPIGPGVPAVAGRSRWRWLSPFRMLSDCGRFLFRRKQAAADTVALVPSEHPSDIAPAESPPPDIMSISEFVAVATVEADDNLDGALGCTLNTAMPVVRAVEFGSLVDTCVTIEEVLRRRMGFDDSRIQCVVYAPDSQRPCVHFRLPYALSLTDLYLHMLRNLHDSILAIELTADSDSTDTLDIDVWVFMQSPCVRSLRKGITRDAVDGADRLAIANAASRVAIVEHTPPHALKENLNRPPVKTWGGSYLDRNRTYRGSPPALAPDTFAQPVSQVMPSTAALLEYNASARAYVHPDAPRGHVSSARDLLADIDGSYHVGAGDEIDDDDDGEAYASSRRTLVPASSSPPPAVVMQFVPPSYSTDALP